MKKALVNFELTSACIFGILFLSHAPGQRESKDNFFWGGELGRGSFRLNNNGYFVQPHKRRIFLDRKLNKIIHVLFNRRKRAREKVPDSFSSRDKISTRRRDLILAVFRAFVNDLSQKSRLDYPIPRRQARSSVYA